MKNNVFISYRRADTKYVAHAVHRGLVAKFGEDRVFYDKGIQPGDNFVEKLNQTLDQCDVLIALIGPDWLNEENKSRLHEQKDWVRVEISTALERKISVIPVIARNAKIPEVKDLPVELAELPNLQAVVFQDDIDYGLHQLAKAIDKDIAIEQASSTVTKEEKIGSLVRRARLLKAEADQMYLNQIRKAKPLDFKDNATASIDLGTMLEDFDEAVYEAKLQESYHLLKQAEKIDNTNVEVLLVLAELLIDLTPDDPSDEQALLYKVQALISNPRDGTERYQLAKATFLLASSGDNIQRESLLDARIIFEQLDRRDWVRQCDDLLASLEQPTPNSGAAHNNQQLFSPIGNWIIRDTSFYASTWQMQFLPNGTFQGYQQTPEMGIEGPVQGQWGFDPARNILAVQGILNGMVPFGTNIILQGLNGFDWYGFGNDGIAYTLTSA